MNVRKYTMYVTNCIVGGLGFISAFYTTVELMLFLSNPHKPRNAEMSKDVWLTTSWVLLIDMALLTVFIIQHSVLASAKLKTFLNNKGLNVLYRSLYIITTSVALQVLMKYWQYSPYFILWKFNLNYRPCWWLYYGIHGTSWILIYAGNICMDINELLGVKQIYYSMNNLPDPNLRKSQQLKRLNTHIRHPSFLAFILIFWITSIMSLDHLLLSSLFSLYMYIAWNTEENDYDYQKNQYEIKFHELQRLHS